MILLAVAAALIVAMGLALARASLGPNLFDRIQAANTVGTCAMAFLAVIAFHEGWPARIGTLRPTAWALVGCCRTAAAASTAAPRARVTASSVEASWAR